MTQNDRIQNFIRQYQILKPEIKVTPLTTIKGQTIERICQFEGERPYGRLLRWVENTIKKNAIEKIQAESPKLFDKPVKEKKIRKPKKEKVVEVPKTSIGEVLIAFKLEKLTLEDTVYIIRKHYEK